MTHEVTNNVYVLDTTLLDAPKEGVTLDAPSRKALVSAAHDMGVLFVAAEAADPALKALNAPNKKGQRLLEACRLTSFALLGDTRHMKETLEGPNGSVVVSAPTLGGAEAETLSRELTNVKQVHKQALFRALDFFEAYAQNKEAALGLLETAWQSGADWLLLSDTSGTTRPYQVRRTMTDVRKRLPYARLGFDGNGSRALDNGLEAVLAGARLLTGTQTGLGGKADVLETMEALSELKDEEGRAYRMGVPGAVKTRLCTAMGATLKDLTQRVERVKEGKKLDSRPAFGGYGTGARLEVLAAV